MLELGFGSVAKFPLKFSEVRAGLALVKGLMRDWVSCKLIGVSRGCQDAKQE